MAPDLSMQLKTAQQQQQAIINMRCAIAKDLMCELVATELVCGSTEEDGEPDEDDDWKQLENVDMAKQRLDKYAELAVYGATSLMVNLGVLRKKAGEDANGV